MAPALAHSIADNICCETLIQAQDTAESKERSPALWSTECPLFGIYIPNRSRQDQVFAVLLRAVLVVLSLQPNLYFQALRDCDTSLGNMPGSP